MLDSIFKSGQASDIVAILSKYDDEAIVAINKILDKDAVATLIRDYGDDGVKVAVKGGDYLVKAINNLDDDAAELFVKTVSKQSDEFFDIVKNCDDCIDDVIKHTIADCDKFPDVLLNANQKGGILRVNDVVKGANSAEDILSTGRKITEGTDEWKKVSMYYEEQVDIIRNKNKGVHALGQNVSYTELNINGSKNSIQATSGSKQIDGFADLVGNKDNTIDPQRFFETKYIDRAGNIGEGWNRAIDTEAKTLEQIVRDLGSVKDADGTILWSKVSSTGAINIFTELAPCSSCRSVIEQFNRAYPGIVVNVYWK